MFLDRDNSSRSLWKSITSLAIPQEVSMTIHDEANRKGMTTGEYLQWVWHELGNKKDGDNTGFMAAKHYLKTGKLPSWYSQWKCKEKEKDYYLPAF